MLLFVPIFVAVDIDLIALVLSFVGQYFLQQRRNFSTRSDDGYGYITGRFLARGRAMRGEGYPGTLAQATLHKN